MENSDKIAKIYKKHNPKLLNNNMATKPKTNMKLTSTLANASKSVRVKDQILSLLEYSPEGLTLREICHSLCLSRSQVSGRLSDLQKSELVFTYKSTIVGETEHTTYCVSDEPPKNMRVISQSVWRKMGAKKKVKIPLSAWIPLLFVRYDNKPLSIDFIANVLKEETTSVSATVNKLVRDGKLEWIGEYGETRLGRKCQLLRMK